MTEQQKSLHEIASKFLADHAGNRQALIHNFMVDFMKLCYRYEITDFRDEDEIVSMFGYDKVE